MLEELNTDFRNPFNEKLTEYELKLMDINIGYGLEKTPINIVNATTGEKEESNYLDVCCRIATDAFRAGFSEAVKYGTDVLSQVVDMSFCAFRHFAEEKGVYFDDAELSELRRNVIDEFQERMAKDNK